MYGLDIFGRHIFAGTFYLNFNFFILQDRLGVGSIGAPTPDHVCVCGPADVTAPPSEKPSSQPTHTCADSPLVVGSLSPPIMTTCPDATPTDCEVESIASTCPLACGACTEWACEDSLGFVHYLDTWYKCTDLETFSRKKVRNLCTNNPNVYLTCRGTCEWCES